MFFLTQFIERVINISPSELPRSLYSWVLRFVFLMSITIGWTVIIASAVSRFSINFLPYLLLLQAVFTIIGMLLFSVLVDRFKVKFLIKFSVLFSIATLIVASLNYYNDLLFIIFALMANGIFLSQAGILLSNYIEEFFSPSEAERTFPVIESSETIAGIVAGIILAILGHYLLGQMIFWIWAALLLVFLLILFFLEPVLPFFLHDIEKKSHYKKKAGMNANAITKSISLIKETPFLQNLIFVLVLNWIISIFIEFQFTKAVNDTIVGHESMQDHEQFLTHGLGTLHILVHSAALLVQLFLAGRILKGLGTFGSFLLHSLMTLMGTFVLLFSNGFFASVLLKNNYSMSGVLQKNAYETTYYAYEYGSQKSLREFFEGTVYPAASILGTIIIIAIQFFFLEQHFIYVIQLALAFLIGGMIFFTYQLKSKYTDLNIQNLNSGDLSDQFRAIEILAQKGHSSSVDLLAGKYNSTNDTSQKFKIINKLSTINNDDAVKALIKIYSFNDDRFKASIIRAFKEMQHYIDTKSSLKKDIIQILKGYLSECQNIFENAVAVSVLAAIDCESVLKYLSDENPIIMSQAAISLWKRGMHKSLIKSIIIKIIKSESIEDKWALVYFSGNMREEHIENYVYQNIKSQHDELRLICLLCAMRMHNFEVASSLSNLLLYGNEVIFNKGVEVISILKDHVKRQIAKSLIPYDSLESIPKTEEGQKIIMRLLKLYKACDAGDEIEYINYNLNELAPNYCTVNQ